MANLTDPLIRAVQGTDPQNLMEYITRQKIYDSRFWKEECFGLSVADVLEKAAKTLTCVGGTFGANQRPTKFLCLTLKLLQLQPETELIQQEFVHQDHFKYVRALGTFYLRLTGRPADIYETLENLYQDFSKLKLRETSQWKLVHMDEWIHDLLTQPYCVGIALPRLPARETLQQEGYLEEGPRATALKEQVLEVGGLEEYLVHKIKVQQSEPAIALWEKRSGKSYGKLEPITTGDGETSADRDSYDEVDRKRQKTDQSDQSETKVREKRSKKKKEPNYGSLFKKGKSGRTQTDTEHKAVSGPAGAEEGSDEYWNQQRAKLGLKPLR